MTVIIIQQYPDEELKDVKEGLSIVEEALVLNSIKEQTTPRD